MGVICIPSYNCPNLFLQLPFAYLTCKSLLEISCVERQWSFTLSQTLWGLGSQLIEVGGQQHQKFWVPWEHSFIFPYSLYCWVLLLLFGCLVLFLIWFYFAFFFLETEFHCVAQDGLRARDLLAFASPVMRSKVCSAAPALVTYFRQGLM